MPAFREQEVRFGFDGDAAGVDARERARALAVLAAVPFDSWSAPSRCPGWSVHDVVRHVAQMTEALVETVEAARAGGRATRLRGFDPRTTPQALLDAAPPAAPEETLAEYGRTTRAWTAAVAGLPGTDLVLDSPTGRQPWPRVVLHGLFDLLVHERDVTEPLGRSAPAGPDQLPVLAYVLLLAARVACAHGRELAVTLDAGRPIRVAVAGPVVEVVPGDGGGVAVDPLATLDALAGRAPLGPLPPELGLLRGAL